MTATPSPRDRRPRAGIASRLAREANATFAIAWREVLRAVKSPLSIAFTVIFPVLFIGILGGSISQNLGGALPYAYLPFMLIGMIANTMYQGTITGRHQPRRGARERLHRRALRRADLALHACCSARSSGRASRRWSSLVGIIAMIFVMQIPMDSGDLLRVIALTPILALAGGALGVFFIGFVQDPKTVAIGVPLLIFPQMFLSGALIPVASSTGLLGLLAKLMPMTYSIDLARNIFYAGKPEYGVHRPPPVVARPRCDRRRSSWCSRSSGRTCSSGPTGTADPRPRPCGAQLGWTRANTRRGPGIPLSSCSPRSSNTSSDPSSRSRVVAETRTSPAPASAAIRAAAWTANPRGLPATTSTSPVWAPVRTRSPRSSTAGSMAAAQRTARAGESNIAIRPSPVVATSRPRWTSSWRRSRVLCSTISVRQAESPIRPRTAVEFDDVREQNRRQDPIARLVGRLAVAGGVRPLDRDIWHVPDDPGVMASRDLVDVAGMDVHLGAVVHPDVKPSAQGVGDVANGAARSPDHGLDIRRPPPARRQADLADDRLVEVDGLDSPAAERAHPIRSDERLPL